MSCHLVGEDFTACYFLDPTLENECDSSDSETYIDDSFGSETDIESVTSDGTGQDPFRWQSMVRIPYSHSVSDEVFNRDVQSHCAKNMG